MWAQSNLLLYSVQRDAMLQRCPGPDTIWLLPLGPLLLTLYSDGKKKKESGEERLISARRRLNSLSLALVARLKKKKKKFYWHCRKAVSGEFISIVFRGGFHCDVVEMLFHTLFHLAKNTFLEEKLAEISTCVTSPAIRREKRWFLHCMAHLRREIRPVTFLPFPLKTIWASFMSLLILFFFFLPDCVNDQNTEAPLLQVILHSHLTCSHLRDLLSFLSSLPYFFFQELLLGFHSLSYWSQSAHVRLA